MSSRGTTTSRIAEQIFLLLLLLLSISSRCIQVQAFQSPATRINKRIGQVATTTSHDRLYRKRQQRHHSLDPVLYYPNNHLLAKSKQNAEPSKAAVTTTTTNPLLLSTSTLLRRTSFVSWWLQALLTTTATILLLFCSHATSLDRDAAIRHSDPSFGLSTTGMILSAVSLLWTWANGARLGRRLVRADTKLSQAAQLLRRAIRIGVLINMTGLLLHLLAACEIVGVLAIRVMTGRNGYIYSSSGDGLQPLDILVVQANTNGLLSHYSSLAVLLCFTRTVRKLEREGRKNGSSPNATATN